MLKQGRRKPLFRFGTVCFPATTASITTPSKPTLISEDHPSDDSILAVGMLLAAIDFLTLADAAIAKISTTIAEPTPDIEALLDSAPNEVLVSLEREVKDIDLRKPSSSYTPATMAPSFGDESEIEADELIDDTSISAMRELFEKGQHEVCTCGYSAEALGNPRAIGDSKYLRLRKLPSART